MLEHQQPVRLCDSDVRAGRTRSISAQQNRSDKTGEQRPRAAFPQQSFHLQSVRDELLKVS